MYTSVTRQHLFLLLKVKTTKWEWGMFSYAPLCDILSLPQKQNKIISQLFHKKLFKILMQFLSIVLF